MELGGEIYLDSHWAVHVLGDERWPMEATSNTYFRGVGNQVRR